MNTRRAAEIHREIAQLHVELAEAMAPDAPDAPDDDAPRKRTKVHPAPLHKASEIDVARARKMLRRRGMST